MKRRFHLPYWLKILVFIGNNEGLYVRELSEKTRITTTTIQEVVKGLDRMGYVAWKHKTTNRIKNYYLTEKGRMAFEVLKSLEADSFLILGA